MEETDLPRAVRTLQLSFQPSQLLGIHVVAIQREKSHPVVRFKSVIALSIHIEWLVETLLRIIMIAESRVELDSG